MSRLLFIDDFFADQITGGAELNNKELIDLLISRLWDVVPRQSHLVQTKDILNSEHIIISNFINLKPNLRNQIIESGVPYIVYEHDHKYLRGRNPAAYKDYIAPQEDIINFEFYKEASAVVCQTKFHADIVSNNLKTENIVNLSGNLWSPDSLQLLEQLSTREKRDCSSIMNSNISHKNTFGAIRFCKKKNMKYDLIDPAPPQKFLENLSRNKNLVFFPLTPETLSRVVVEARMMGMAVMSNNLIGATKEPWFKKKGKELIQYFVDQRDTIPTVIENAF
jgi:hypothetical protein